MVMVLALLYAYMSRESCICKGSFVGYYWRHYECIARYKVKLLYCTLTMSQKMLSLVVFYIKYINL